MLKVQKNQLIDFHRNLPEKRKPKGTDILSVPSGAERTATTKMNKTASSASLKLSGFFSQKNKVSFNGARTGLLHNLGQSQRVKNLFTNEKLQKTLKGFTNLGFWESVAVFTMSVTVKPLSLLAVPGAKEEDKKYAATKAILAGCVDFALTSAVLAPLGKYTKKLGKKIKENPQLIKEVAPSLLKTENGKKVLSNRTFKRFNTVVTYLPKFIMIPLRAALTIALIPATLKVLFPDEAQNLNPKKQKMRRYLAKKAPINFSNNPYNDKNTQKLFKTFTGGLNYANQ